MAADSDSRPVAVRYHLINAIILNEVQKQQRVIENQQIEIALLKAQNEDPRGAAGQAPVPGRG